MSGDDEAETDAELLELIQEAVSHALEIHLVSVGRRLRLRHRQTLFLSRGLR